MSKPIALITGASAGIGATFARHLAGRGFELVLVARRREKLAELASQLSTPTQILVADLSAAADRRRIADYLAAEPRLELLINNAGFGTLRRFWEADLAGQQAMHEVHVMATVELTHAALGNFVSKQCGAVINVASVAAFAQSQGNVSYCATKAWMLTFTQSLAMELKGAGSPVRVQALCPGFTHSEFHDVMGVDRTRIPAWLWMDADNVVEASLEGLERGRIVVVPGLAYSIFVSLFPRLPMRLRLWLQSRSPHTQGRV